MSAAGRRGVFAPMAGLALIGGGTMLFVALLWMLGAGLARGTLDDGGAHGAGRGLTGYAALSRLLERQGWDVAQARSEAQLAQPGLLVLTPPMGADGQAIARIAARRRSIGPTLVILPKWRAAPLQAGGGPGWISLAGADLPRWRGFLDQVAVQIDPAPADRGWEADGVTGVLPDTRAVLTGAGGGLIPLVRLREGGGMLAGRSDGAAGDQPLVVVFEPDLLDNYGLASRETALAALRLIEGANGAAPRRVAFDLTLNGFARRRNLLTLAFTPPFLAAPLCLLMAAGLAGWRAFLRFGPVRASGAAVPVFGKAQLVANVAGLVRRSGRLHLLGPPYAAMVRERLARALGLAHHGDPALREAAIDRALALRAPDATLFSTAAEQLRRARRPADLLRAAQTLHAIERTLER